MGREMAPRPRGRTPISKENGGVTAGQAKILKGAPATPLALSWMNSPQPTVPAVPDYAC